MIKSNSILRTTIFVATGTCLGIGASSWYWHKRILHLEQDVLQTSVQRNMALLGTMDPSQQSGVYNRLSYFLACDLEALNDKIQSGRSDPREARLILTQVADWRSRHSSLKLTTKLEAELVRSISLAR